VVGVVGEDCAQILLETAGGCGARCAMGEIRQDWLGGLLVTGLQVAEGFLGRGGLLLVAVLLMPLGGVTAARAKWSAAKIRAMASPPGSCEA